MVVVSSPNQDGTMTFVGESREEAQRLTSPLTSPKHKLIIGNWNVRTMYAAGKAAQIAQEMRNERIEILGISESRWNGSDRIKLATGETIIYSGRDDDTHIHGVAIMLTPKAAAALIDWTAVSERIIIARFYSKHIKLTIIHAYCPTNGSAAEEKDSFYELLNDTIQKVHRHDILVVTGDFNAKVGSQPSPYEDVMGKHGVGERNNNGERLCEFCAENELLITGTLFPHKTIHKLTWVSPDGVTKNQIDHILVNKKFRTSVRDTRVYRGADISSDHYLVKTCIKLKLKTKPRQEQRKPKYDTDKLEDDNVKKQFCLELNNRYKALEVEYGSDDEEIEDIEILNNNLETAFNETAKEILGYRKNKSKPWISQESWALIAERKQINNRIINTRSERTRENLRDQYKGKDKEIKKQIKIDKKAWIDNMAKEAEEAAGKHHMKTLYSITKRLSNEKPKKCMAINDKDNQTITNSEDRRKRWKEHFNEILNRPEPDDPLTIETDEIELVDIDINPPTLREIQEAIKKLKNGKAPGADLIQAELLKANINYSSRKIKAILNRVWEQEKAPQSWRRGLIVKLPKKGNLKHCKNWRGITLLPIISKILGRIVIDKIRRGLDHKLRKEQAGYRSNRSTIDQIFVLRNIIEQSIEWQASLYINFIDFEKAFDSIHRESLWKIMEMYGIPLKIIGIIKALYDNFECAVIDGNETTEWFKIKTGVKQGCNMSGFLFLLVIDWIMRRTAGNGENGIRWKFTTKLDDLDFADDIALLSTTKNQIQQKTNRLVNNSQKVGLRTNREKCKIIRINTTNSDRITINEEPVEEVNKFEYLGAVVSDEGGGTQDINNRINKARTAFHRLKNIWGSNNIRQKTKLKLFKTLVIPVLLYGSETWKMTEGDNNRIDTFQSKCLRRILKIKWQDHIRNAVVMERAGMERISQDLRKRRWKYIGHTLRKDPENDCMTALSWAPEGRRKCGRPKTTWRRTVEKERNRAGWTSWNQARTIAKDRDVWREQVEALCATWHEVDR